MANALKNYKQYSYISRYESVPYFYDAVNKRYYYGLSYNLADVPEYVVHIVQAGDSFDSIALNYYGCALYYWVICDYNNIIDSMRELEVGEKLLIPSFNSIQFKGE